MIQSHCCTQNKYQNQEKCKFKKFICDTNPSPSSPMKVSLLYAMLMSVGFISNFCVFDLVAVCLNSQAVNWLSWSKIRPYYSKNKQRYNSRLRGNLIEKNSNHLSHTHHTWHIRWMNKMNEKWQIYNVWWANFLWLGMLDYIIVIWNFVFGSPKCLKFRSWISKFEVEIQQTFIITRFIANLSINLFLHSTKKRYIVKIFRKTGCKVRFLIFDDIYDLPRIWILFIELTG